MSRTRIISADAPDLQSDAEMSTHAGDTTAVHGITDTLVLSTTAHDHDADYEAAGGIATHSADTTAVHGITDAAALVVDGDAAGGELAGTYPSPTVAASHAGGTHAATQTAAEATAAGALTGHEADTSVHGIADTTVLATDAEVATAVSDHAAAADPHPTYLTQAEGDAAYEVTGATATHAGAANPHATYLTQAEGDALYQPTDGDLTAIAALTTTAFGRGLLALADAAALGAAHSHSGATTTYAPGSFTVATGNYSIMSKRLELTTTQRVTLQGTARLRIT